MELRSAWLEESTHPSLMDVWRKTISLPLALVLAGPAIAVFLLSRRSSRRREDGVEIWFKGLLERARRALSPGLPEGEQGRFVAAALMLFMAFLIAAIPFAAEFGFGRLIAIRAGSSLAWGAAGCGLVLLVLLRFMFGDSSSSRRG